MSEKGTGAERYARASFAVLCAYEAVAVATGRVPTVSAVCRRRRWVEAGLLGFLLLHLHRAARAVSAPGPQHTGGASQ